MLARRPQRRCGGVPGVAAVALTVFAFVTASAAAGSPQDGSVQVASEMPQHSTSRAAAPATERVTKTTEKNFVSNLFKDQTAIWTAPAHLRVQQASWIVPGMALTAGFIAGDQSMSAQLSSSPQRLSRSHDIADFGLASMAGVAGSMYVWGRFSGDEHKRETGLLAAEAAVNATAVAESLKLLTGRERPIGGTGQGRFWRDGASFPSEHSMAAWSIASVLAHEYDGIGTKLFAYGAASAISLARVSGKDHFPSDVLVGSALGWLIGRQVYRAHHDNNLPGKNFGSFQRHAERGLDPGNMGSPYVPLDSGIYAAFDRLNALGYVNSDFAGLRPWTRRECARLTEEAGRRVAAEDEPLSEAYRIYKALAQEFATDIGRNHGDANYGAGVESIYTRVGGISGPPLHDGFHFAQTQINDFGRPYGEGVNAVAGLSSSATAGPVSIHLRAEYQHSAPASAYSPGLRSAIAAADGVSSYPAASGSSVDRFHLLDAYLGMTWKDTQFSFGKQSLWWGLNAGGTMLFTNNADPIPMLRVDRVTPFRIPGVSRLMGPLRVQAFVGWLDGYKFVTLVRNGTLIEYGAPVRPRPYIHGEKFTFKPTPNLEFGFSETRIFSGPGTPFTWRSFLRSYGLTTTIPSTPTDPGDGRSAFEFSYRIPGLRNWLVLYADSFTEDEYSPIAYPRRSAMNPGIYLPRIPKIPKLDLRVEGVYTDLPGLQGTGVYYANTQFRSGYTNDGNLMASWIGRQGTGVQAWSTYWLSPVTRLQLGYRDQRVNPNFLGGGRLQDFSSRADIALERDVMVSCNLQHERWSFPLLSPQPQSNTSASVTVTYSPKWARASGTR